jgi:hypothetical protein
MNLKPPLKFCRLGTNIAEQRLPVELRDSAGAFLAGSLRRSDAVLAPDA